jgi:hypothetical protein
MKKLSLVLSMIIVGQIIVAQENESLFDALYVGSLHTMHYDYDQNNLTNLSGFRLGVLKYFDLPLGKIQASATYDHGLGCSMNTLKWQIPVLNFLKIEIGSFTRPITLHRPMPPSAASHFEPPALSVIPASAIGINSIFTISSGHNLMLGVYESPNKKIELNGAYRITDLQGWNINISAYHDLKKRYGIAISGESSWVYTNFFKSEEWTAYLLCVNLPNDVSPYLTANFAEKNNLKGEDNLEIGLTKTFKKEISFLPIKANILIGPGIGLIPELYFNFYFQFWIDL